MEQQDIFDDGRFPYAHMPTITEIASGLAAAFYAGTTEGHSDVCIWFSCYENAQWSSPRMIADGIEHRGRRHACWDPKILRRNGGELILFYSIGPDEGGKWGMMSRSNDLGQTWSQPRRLTLDNIPYSRRSPVEVGNDVLILSTDRSSGCSVNLRRKSEGTFAPLRLPIVTYPDGRMQLMVRNSTGTLQERWSDDGGQSWSNVENASIRHANSFMDAIRLHDDRVLLVYNPSKTRERWPLALAITTDGHTWTDVLVLEADKGRYSGPVLLQTVDNMVHVIYAIQPRRLRHIIVDQKEL